MPLYAANQRWSDVTAFTAPQATRQMLSTQHRGHVCSLCSLKNDGIDWSGPIMYA
jgi:hypothetical protein